MHQPPLILVYINHALGVTARSGIQRVTAKIAEHLPHIAEVEFVTWDYADGQLRYLDARLLDKLFLTERWPQGVRCNPRAHRVNYRFGDTLPRGRPAWLLMPEIAYHAEAGTEVTRRIISMCREYGVRTATVFYDAIPVTNAAYRGLKAAHVEYMTQIARCDRIYTISHHSRQEALRFYRRHLEPTDPLLADLTRRIIPVPLGEAEKPDADRPRNEIAECNRVLLLGTVEPRKGQLRVIEAFRSLEAKLRDQFELHVAGSLHPDVAREFNALIASSPRFFYHGYVPAARSGDLYSRVRFSVFASDDEGFGLPIVESLARGTPCLSANFGAMAETARGGGCLTLDVRDTRALAHGLERLLTDNDLIERLRSEIAGRKLRTWSDYARALAADMAAQSAAEAAAETDIRKQIHAALESRFVGNRAEAPDCATVHLEHSSLKLVIDAGDNALAVSHPARDGSHEFRVAIGSAEPGSDADHAERAAYASACVLRRAEELPALVDAAREAGCSDMLPPTYVVEGGGLGAAAEGIVRQICSAQRRRQVAERERLLRRLASRRATARDSSLPLLTIVISTYNRARFVEENVRWLLGVLAKYPEDVRLVVVDNASTDDTLERLAKFSSAPRLTVISNPVNVGMLGNLRVCASLLMSKHVWITGDDDFILPDGLAEVVDALGEHPEIPFAFVNFGIYHRTKFAPDDTVRRLVAERAPLAARTIRSGVYPVARIAEQHDNLFTAFYPIVFRSDLLAACFNYPFDGRPFADLVESVPTTKMLLETYADTEAYWCARMGTVGNICNSWSRHRPRWHAVLMPRVFALAREAGVDAVRLQAWSAMHFDLFHEAKQQAIERGAPLDISADELDDAYRVFRQPVSLA